MSLGCVVDASVAVKLFLDEPLSDRAHALFDHLAAEPAARFYVPEFFFIECTNILWKYVWRFGYPLRSALRDLADLTELPFHVAPTRELAADSLALAAERGIAAYDAAYAALGRALSLPLVTADEVLVGRLTGAPVAVRWLGEWP